MINYPKDEYEPRATTHPLNPPTGSPIPAAYEVDGVLDLDCETCDVPAGSWCETAATEEPAQPLILRKRI